MIWYRNLPPYSIDSFAILADTFIKAHTGAIKIETRKSDLFKVKQRHNEMLKEFMSRFHIERMDLPPVADDWAVQAFTQGLNPRSTNRRRLTRTPSGSAYPIRTNDRSKRVIDQEPRLVRDRYQLYSLDRRGNESRRHLTKKEKKSDRESSDRGLMSKSGFDRSLGSREAPRLSEYNFNVDVASIVSAIGCIKETKWPRPLQSDLAERDPNLMCKYHDTHGHRTKDCR
nr:uncharacterized protein LOC104119033 [Nicotiana tomentosiformis]